MLPSLSIAIVSATNSEIAMDDHLATGELLARMHPYILHRQPIAVNSQSKSLNNLLNRFAHSEINSEAFVPGLLCLLDTVMCLRSQSHLSNGSLTIISST